MKLVVKCLPTLIEPFVVDELPSKWYHTGLEFAKLPRQRVAYQHPFLVTLSWYRSSQAKVPSRLQHRRYFADRANIAVVALRTCSIKLFSHREDQDTCATPHPIPTDSCSKPGFKDGARESPFSCEVAQPPVVLTISAESHKVASALRALDKPHSPTLSCAMRV